MRAILRRALIVLTAVLVLSAGFLWHSKAKTAATFDGIANDYYNRIYVDTLKCGVLCPTEEEKDGLRKSMYEAVRTRNEAAETMQVARLTTLCAAPVAVLIWLLGSWVMLGRFTDQVPNDNSV